MDFDLNDDGYRSPIDLFVCSYEGELNNIAKQISEQTDNAITAEIVQRFEIDVNKEELLRALAYDRDQYHKGYMAGYQRGLQEGKETAMLTLGESLIQKYGKKEEEGEDNEDD